MSKSYFNRKYQPQNNQYQENNIDYLNSFSLSRKKPENFDRSNNPEYDPNNANKLSHVGNNTPIYMSPRPCDRLVGSYYKNTASSYNGGLAYNNANSTYITQQFQQNARESDSSNGKKCVVCRTDEIFMPHPKLQNIYVSNYGRVYDSRVGLQLNPFRNDADGYYRYSIDGMYYYAHKLVAETFYRDSPMYGNMVNHINGDKSDNNLWNLEWCDNSYNVSKAIEKRKAEGTFKSNWDKGTWFDDQKKHYICSLIQDGYDSREIAKILGVNYNTNFTKMISKVRKGERWRDISCNYVFPEVQLSKETVANICELLTQNKTAHEIANIIGIEYTPAFATTVSGIRRGKNHTDVSSNYDIKETLNNRQLIEKICDLIEIGYSGKQLADALGVENSNAFKKCVDRLRRGEIWKDITARYNNVLKY